MLKVYKMSMELFYILIKWFSCKKYISDGLLLKTVRKVEQISTNIQETVFIISSGKQEFSNNSYPSWKFPTLIVNQAKAKLTVTKAPNNAYS